MARRRTRDSGEGKNTNPHKHTGSPRAEMGRGTKKFPYGQSPFLKKELLAVGKYFCLVPHCVINLSMKWSLRRHFLDHHPQDLVVIPSKGTVPYPKFERCGMQTKPGTLLEWGKGYIVLHAVCPACRSDTFGTVLPFCIQQNILTMNGRHFPFKHSLRVGWRNLFSSRFVVLC